MKKRYLVAFLLMLTLTILASIIPMTALAQEITLPPGYTDNNGNNTIAALEEGFQWWWLLIPIAIVPLLPLLFKGEDEELKETTREYQRAAATYHDVSLKDEDNKTEQKPLRDRRDSNPRPLP